MNSTAPQPPQPSPAKAALIASINAALPQTQCTRCGYPDCLGYASALADGQAPINRCPPGGAEGIVRLARITGQPAQALDAACGQEGPRGVALIDEAWCIGCTLCLDACPVDAILGANKRLHTVLADVCNGCELCLPVCPVDCITMHPVTGNQTGWAAWNAALAGQSQQRHAAHQQRLTRRTQDNGQRLAAAAEATLADLGAHSQITDTTELERKRAVVAAALARARQRAAGPP